MLSQTNKLGLHLGSIPRLPDSRENRIFPRACRGAHNNVAGLKRAPLSPLLVSDWVVTYDDTACIKAAPELS